VADPRSGASEEGAKRGRHRPPIAERAARRDRLTGGRDRYASLVRALRAGREVPLRPRRRSRLAIFDDLDWHPIGTRLVVLVAAVALVAVGAKLGGDWLRERSVSTWSGPDASVTSGQRLGTCPGVDLPASVETYPNWVRYEGRLYLRSDDVRPGLVDGISYLDSGYRLDHLLLVLLENTPAGRARQEVMVWSDGAMAGYVYRVATGC
jgi:hypothetical protein